MEITKEKRDLIKRYDQIVSKLRIRAQKIEEQADALNKETNEAFYLIRELMEKI